MIRPQGDGPEAPFCPVATPIPMLGSLAKVSRCLLGGRPRTENGEAGATLRSFARSLRATLTVACSVAVTCRACGPLYVSIAAPYT